MASKQQGSVIPFTGKAPTKDRKSSGISIIGNASLNPSGGGDGNALNPESRRGSRRGSYFTFYTKSLRHYLTGERLPREEHYRDINSIVAGQQARPSLHELHNDTFRRKSVAAIMGEIPEGGTQPGSTINMGWVQGVFMKCLLNIWGVMLFLRLSWVAGEAGIIFGTLVILLATVLTTITAISMSAVATNGQIKAGGVYYMISRTLGPEFGGSIGFLYTIANAIAASTHIIGFVNGVQDMCAEYFGVTEIIPGIGGGLNDVRVLGTLLLLFVLFLGIVGLDWVARVEIGLLILLVASQVDFIVGVFMGPTDDDQRSKGFIGFNGDIAAENAKSDYRYFEGEQDFFSVFGVFFSAVTGIFAGANFSGDLKDPGDAIPKGTILAIFVTCLGYAVYPILMGAAVVRDALGNVTLYKQYSNYSVYDNPSFNRSYCPDQRCPFGLQNSFQVMELVSAWGPLIYLGTYAATLSSAISCLTGAPRILQALGKDRLYPYMEFFEVGWGSNNDPVRGYVLVFLISFACIMFGQLNAVGTLLTNCFLATYFLINFACFHASLIRSPGWRPSFKCYNVWVSLIGAVASLFVMFLTDWITAVLTLAVGIALFMYVKYKQPEINWGSTLHGQSYLIALKSSLDLVKIPENVKNYRPQILVLSGNPCFRPPLVHFASSITGGTSFLACANIIEGRLNHKTRQGIINRTYKWFDNHKVRSFYTLVDAKNLEEGSRYLFQFVGLGNLRPNMVLLGFKTDWRDCDEEELECYFNTLHEALNFYLGIAILRVPNGLDYSDILADESKPPVPPSCVVNIQITPPSPKMSISTTTNLFQNGSKNTDDNKHENDDDDDDEKLEVEEDLEEEEEEEKEEENVKDKKKKEIPLQHIYKGIDGAEIDQSVVPILNRFKEKQPKGTIDVWWLYDDGGLTLLLPYILATRSQWSKCKLRVIALANRKNELDEEHRKMINLLSKFRIDVQDVVILPEVAKKAEQKTRDEFDELISKFRTKDVNGEKGGLWITDEELSSRKEKTNRHLRIRELLLENSKEASLIVMTLPMPRKNKVSAPLYMAWLETLTKDMPPFLFVRGNQQSVLTFYS